MRINGIEAETFEHPEIGLVLADNSGAAGEPGSNAFAGHQWPPSALIRTLRGMRRPNEVPVISSVLAGDGWWWYPTGR